MATTEVTTTSNSTTSLMTSDASDSKHTIALTGASSVAEGIRFQRQLGNGELSYYLPSRENGVNDMYLHIGFRAPTRYVRGLRPQLVWAILRLRHPLLASAIVMNDYDDVRFEYTKHQSPEAALQDAQASFRYNSQTKDELLESYLNGPRTLSNTRLSYLFLSSPDFTENGLSSVTADSVHQCEYFMCATHYLGDGMALHQFTNDFFGLLGGGKSDSELRSLLEEEWQQRWGSVDSQTSVLPPCLEDALPPSNSSRFKRAAEKIDYLRHQDKQIGGHSFPRRSGKPCHTIVPTISLDADRTVRILKVCKAHGVSISAAMFSICNLAWAKMVKDKKEHPMMMYSALNMRPYLVPNQTLYNSYWFLAVGYFNVILPSFLPSSCDAKMIFWNRARAAKEQSTRAVKNRMIVSRAQQMAQERGARAKIWAKEDDEKAAGTWQAPAPTPKSSSTPKPLSTALIGLSLLGNLDGIYKHATFPDLQLHTLTTGSRQRPGGMLLFSYTFAGKLWVSLGYDENGFDKAVVDEYWGNVLSGIDFYISD